MEKYKPFSIWGIEQHFPNSLYHYLSSESAIYIYSGDIAVVDMNKICGLIAANDRFSLTPRSTPAPIKARKFPQPAAWSSR